MLSGCPAAAPPPSRLFHKTPSSYDNQAGSLPAGKLRLTIQSAPPRAVCGFPHGWSVKNKVSPITPHKRCSYSQEMITSQLCWQRLSWTWQYVGQQEGGRSVGPAVEYLSPRLPRCPGTPADQPEGREGLLLVAVLCHSGL